jgi:hypothetical protein
MPKKVESIKPHGELHERTVNTTIDTIMNLLKDFLDEDIFPKDAQPLQLMIKPGTKELGIMCTSEQWDDTGNDSIKELPVSFNMKRIHKV